jgi:hypothetical protein
LLDQSVDTVILTLESQDMQIVIFELCERIAGFGFAGNLFLSPG